MEDSLAMLEEESDEDMREMLKEELNRYHKGHVFHASDTDFLALRKLYLPAFAFGIMDIHTVNLRRKESRWRRNLTRI